KGLPESVEITDKDMCDFLIDEVSEVIDKIRGVFEQTPPELVGDILTNGIVLTGGGALLKGLPELITKIVGAPCYVAEDPVECVAKGIQKAFKHADELLDGFEKISLYRYK
ncbi:MAG: rod shape-determining protein, partial [Ruminiclostridium sp.]|nr:rod shape-determining protein [Ruminiclostridium sp.]